MPLKNIVTQQHVSETMYETARLLRRRMTTEEKILWRHLRADRLGFHFRRQQIIDKYVVDFYCHTASLVVELDGEIHKYQGDSDREREDNLSARGLAIMRFKNKDITQNLQNVLKQISDTCRARTRSPQTSPKGNGNRERKGFFPSL